MKAIMGTMADANTMRLLDEIRALRARVAELETALETAEAVASTAPEDVRIEVEEPVLETTATA